MRLLPLLFVFSSLLRAQNTEVQYFGESFDVFTLENDRDSINLITQKILERFPGEFSLLQKIFDETINRKDRKALITIFAKVLKTNHCFDIAAAKSICTKLQTLWSEHLMHLNFYDESLVKWKKGKNFIVEQRCPEAISLLKEVEAREGPYMELLLSQREAFTCLKDQESVKTLSLRIERLKIPSHEN